MHQDSLIDAMPPKTTTATVLERFILRLSANIGTRIFVVLAYYPTHKGGNPRVSGPNSR